MKCGYCKKPLKDSLSDYFCDDDCQAFWYESQSTPLETYREPGNGLFDIEVAEGTSRHAHAVRQMAEAEGRVLPADFQDSYWGSAWRDMTTQMPVESERHHWLEYRRREEEQRHNRRYWGALQSERRRGPLTEGEYLFVGGSMHGRVQHVSSHSHVYQVPRQANMRVAMFGSDMAAIDNMTFAVDSYQRRKINFQASGIEARITAYVLSGLELSGDNNVWIVQKIMHLNGLSSDPGEMR